MTLKKKELLEMIKEAKKKVNFVIQEGKKEHDCSFSIVMLRWQGELDILNEILEKFYSQKRKDSRKQRVIKTIKMINFKITRKEKQYERFVKRGLTYKSLDKDINRKAKIRELKKIYESYQKEYILKYGGK